MTSKKKKADRGPLSVRVSPTDDGLGVVFSVGGIVPEDEPGEEGHEWEEESSFTLDLSAASQLAADLPGAVQAAASVVTRNDRSGLSEHGEDGRVA